MTIQKQTLNEILADVARSREGHHGVACGNGVQPSTTTEHSFEQSFRSDSVNHFELVDQLTLEVIHLRMALRSNRRIGMAIGILMNQRNIDDSQAFNVLCRTSQNTNRKLRDVAEDVISNAPDPQRARGSRSARSS